MDDSETQFNLRMPKTLRERIDEVAARNRRSATAEVLVRLEESLRRDGIDPATGEALESGDLAQLISGLAKRLDDMTAVLEQRGKA